ncbi:hypothetical protein ABH937_006366 [Kitasatospora sp. GAS1066B]
MGSDKRGDPMLPLRWTTGSTRALAAELTARHRVPTPSVGSLPPGAGFSLQSNAKVLEDAQHPDRDAQFRCINEQARQSRNSASQPPAAGQGLFSSFAQSTVAGTRRSEHGPAGESGECVQCGDAGDGIAMLVQGRPPDTESAATGNNGDDASAHAAFGR